MRSSAFSGANENMFPSRAVRRWPADRRHVRDRTCHRQSACRLAMTDPVEAAHWRRSARSPQKGTRLSGRRRGRARFRLRVKLDPKVIAELAIPFSLSAYLRVMPRANQTSPVLCRWHNGFALRKRTQPARPRARSTPCSFTALDQTAFRRSSTPWSSRVPRC